MPKKRTTADINAAIAGRLIRRVGYYVNYDTKIEWNCLVCDHDWLATPNNVISKGSGCPECGLKLSAKKKVSGRQITVLAELKDRHIELVSDYTRVKDTHTMRCIKCAHQWSTTLNMVVNSGAGCPSCAGNLKLTNESVDARLAADRYKGIERVGHIINATTKIEWQCASGHVWSAVPDSVLNALTGCGMCMRTGTLFQGLRRDPSTRNTPTTLYVIRFTTSTSSFVKVGVTTQSIIRRFRGSQYHEYQLDVLVESNTGIDNAVKIEQAMLKQLAKYRYADVHFSGYTECFQDISEVHEIINQYIPY